MIKNWINFTRVTIEGAERLYPNGLSWDLAPGINAVIGGTGLGKTTLVYAMQFAVFGKVIVNPSERIEREFFKGRMTSRLGGDLESKPPIVEVQFSIGNEHLSVKRNLANGSIVSACCDKVAILPKKYETTIAEKIGVEGDFLSLARLQAFLFFFGESRSLIAWENRLQHEMVSLMMADHSAYQLLEDLWKKVESADSTARNISAQASRLEKDLKERPGAKSSVSQLKELSEARELTKIRADLHKVIKNIEKRIMDDEQLEATQSQEIIQLHAQFHSNLEQLEDAKSKDLDDEILAAALATPTIASVRRSLEDFYLHPNARGCPCCGRVGIDAAISQLAKAAAKRTNDGNCIVCSKSLPKPSQARKVVTSNSKRTDAKALELQQILFKREQSRSRIAESRSALAKALQELAKASDAELKHVRQNPASDDKNMLIAIQQMRKREAAAKEKREEYLISLNSELTKTNAALEKIKIGIAEAFKKYATLYLDEPCDVKFLNESELPRKGGPQIKAPHAAFFPIVSGQARPSAKTLSDAQRSFVDLAFRMAVIDVWHQNTSETVTMIIETPEGAVDIAYMKRVAAMIRTFGDQGHTLIITTNLNNNIFLPEVMARWPKSKRDTHILNLIEMGNPRPAQIEEKPWFESVLQAVNANSVSK